MAKLYPPIIEGTIPAFYGDSITIPYSMNRTVNRSEFEGFSLKIKTVQNNLHLTTLTSYSYNNSTVTFYLSATDREKLTIAQFYKVQLAYIEKDTKMIGHYSSVGVIKYTEKPEISIECMQAGAYNRHQYIYTGVYSQKDKDYTEKVSTYRFKVYDLDNNVLADTGDLIHDISKDSNDTPYESYDSFEFTKELVSGETCKIQYEITTVNGLHIKTPKYKFVQGAMVKPALDAILTTEVDNENAYVKLGMFGVSNSGDYYYHKDSTELIVTGNFIVSRQRVNEPGNWKELTRFGLYAEKPSTWTWKDCTAEQGVSYIYSIQQYSETITSDRIVSKIWDNNKKIWADGSIYVNFEHAFLFDGERQLKIKYNPKVSSFKTTLQESKLETMGSKYPFVFRNGRIGYKEFPISGLISCLMDEENLFMIDNNFKEYQNYEKQYDDLYRYSTKHSGNGNQVSQLVLTSLEDYNIKKEREFKLAVLDWLNNGKPKLFRSPTEGNYIVRLMNCSLSPNDTLGRMLHTFSCTAYEIASYDDKTLLNMGLTGNIELAAEREVEYITTEELLPHLINYSGEDEWTDNILNSTRKPTNIKFYNMVAGDKIKLITKDSEQVIIIGATGAYSAEGLTQINMIKLHKNNAKVQGMLTYNYKEKLTNEFGLYKEVYNREVPIRQFIGSVNNASKDLRKAIEDIKTELINLHYIQAEKRPVEYIYAADKDNLTLNKIYLDKNKTQPLSSAKLNPCTIYFIRDASILETGDNLGYYNDWNLTGELTPLEEIYDENNVLTGVQKTEELDKISYYEYKWDYEEKFPLITTTVNEKEESLFIDGNDKNKTIHTADKYDTKIYFTKEQSKDVVIDSETNLIMHYDLGTDLTKREFFRLEDFEPKNIFIGSGVILTIGYSSAVYEYNFENSKDYKKAIEDYKLLEEEYFSSGNVSFEELETARLKIVDEYEKVLLYIEENIEQYKKEHGLDE